jgi:uncharacterized protein (DUF1697 family)
MVYVALLRGINVGGNNKINMKELNAVFEHAGMRRVVTYINTGNIIFSDDVHSKAEIVEILEEAIFRNFGLQIKVVVRSMDDYSKVMQALPDSWTNDETMKSDVLFLWDEVNDESILDSLSIKPEIDTVVYVEGALLWSVDRKNVTKSNMVKLVGTKLYKLMTVRNVNTARKIYDLMKSVSNE